MTKEITNFEDFIRRILKIVFWVLLFLPLVGVPVYYLLDTVFHFGVDVFGLITVHPDQLISLQLQLISTEPFHSLFIWTTFPGFTFAALFVTFFAMLWERKLLAKMQLRVGPQYAGKYEGILQMVADLVKLLFKELVTPNAVDKPIFWSVPFASMAIAGALLSLVPLGPNTYLADPPIGVIMIFAIIGFFPIVTLLAGWASNSKYPFLGGLRALHQMISYEIPLILSLLGVVILSGTLDIMKVVVSQEGIWYILLQPIGAIVFFIASLAELERIPFDLPEADTELVAGWVTEYTGMGFGAVFLGIYIKLYALSGLFTAFFLGGWLGPSFLPPELWFLLKTFLVMTAMLIPRGTMPRIRIDLMIRVGWTRLLVLSFANIFLTMLLVSLGIFRIGGL
ncbi:MAG: NADH-quinone oxidoreductase subunit NuoH [Thaumarchaeota archaeon]|nr:MAG: NADH-quinone oxidoreductase subunit NuoH [Nitrososphaerota archaeon]